MKTNKNKENKPKSVQEHWIEMRKNQDDAGMYIGLYNDSHNSHQINQGFFWNDFNIFLKWNRIFEFLMRTQHTDIDKYNILDAGCGSGFDLRRIVDMGATPDKCYGIDFNEDSIKFAKEMSSPKINFSQSLLTKLPFADGFFDLVFSFQVINNYLNDKDIITMSKELRRVMKPTGLMLLLCPLSDVSSKNSGLRDMPTRHFRQEEIESLFPDFLLTTIRYCEIQFNSNPISSFSVNLNNENVNVDLQNLTKVANGWHDQNIFDGSYVHGAMNYLLAALDIQKSGQSMILLKPKVNK